MATADAEKSKTIWQLWKMPNSTKSSHIITLVSKGDKKMTITYWVELHSGIMLDFTSLADAEEYCIMNGIHAPDAIYEEEEEI